MPFRSVCNGMAKWMEVMAPDDGSACCILPPLTQLVRPLMSSSSIIKTRVLNAGIFGEGLLLP